MSLAVEALLVLLLVCAAAVGGDHFGYGRGDQARQVTDQKQFDKLNNDLATQKAQANETYRMLATAATKRGQEAEDYKHQLEVTREKSRTDLAALRSQYDGRSLWFSTTKAAGCGDGSGGTQGSAGSSPGAEAAVRVELPPALRSSLRQLMDEADDLRVDYKACYDWANRPTK